LLGPKRRRYERTKTVAEFLDAVGCDELFWVALSDAVAQTSYKVIDLGVVNDKDNLSCAMDLNNVGWTLSQEGVLDPARILAARQS
jgi:hypothetical protein